MRYIVTKSVVQVIGQIWQPGCGPCAYTYELSDYDVNNARDDKEDLTRESIQDWLDRNAGDFQEITDFYASIEDAGETVEIPWNDEESELTYGDCMNGSED